MAKRLYVGNLAYSVTSDHLQELFEQYGQVRSAQVRKLAEAGVVVAPSNAAAAAIALQCLQ